MSAKRNGKKAQGMAVRRNEEKLHLHAWDLEQEVVTLAGREVYTGNQRLCLKMKAGDRVWLTETDWENIGGARFCE